ncbi:unnamed protein product, partial [Enterobius vermicularis]|uniref:phenylalanine 4-monooxygenase n=1 Tax=Enterobius vermicularis TaxID=51028 RepID=A0A0N4VB83_ENTVE
EQIRYPRKIQELDTLAHTVYNAGVEIDADHPGFKDKEYRKRRQELAEIAFNYRQGQKIPKVKYTKNEIKAWNAVYDALVNNTLPKHACKEYRQVFPLFQKHCGFQHDNIPQLQDISDYLKATSGFLIRPTAGMLSSRDFLASLAFRVFRCTQYIRHHSKPLFTPEPDACHEILGHVPLLADPDYAQFSQEFGLISLGAPDHLISKLASLYWYTIENGLCMENEKMKVYGAALLSAPDEIEHYLSGKPKIRQFDANVVANEKYPLTEKNWQYFVVNSFEDAKRNLMQWALPTRKCQLRYNPHTEIIETLDKSENVKKFTSELKGNVDSSNEKHFLQRLQ